MTRDGRPYGPARFDEILRERYIISKVTNISYAETGKMTPHERDRICKFIMEDAERDRKDMENLSK